jgi:hypothetical protein
MQKFMNRVPQVVIGSTIVVLSFSSLLSATAPAPPELAKAVLGGKPVYVLNMTRSGDRVLVRCYPGQQPSVKVQTRTDGVKEGLLTCGS